MAAAPALRVASASVSYPEQPPDFLNAARPDAGGPDVRGEPQRFSSSISSSTSSSTSCSISSMRSITRHPPVLGAEKVLPHAPQIDGQEDPVHRGDRHGISGQAGYYPHDCHHAEQDEAPSGGAPPEIGGDQARGDHGPDGGEPFERPVHRPVPAGSCEGLRQLIIWRSGSAGSTRPAQPRQPRRPCSSAQGQPVPAPVPRSQPSGSHCRWRSRPSTAP